MRKILLLLSVAFLIFSSNAYAKTAYIAAQDASYAYDVDPIDIGQLYRDGFILNDDVEDGDVKFYISKKKIKKLTVYGDPKDGKLGVLLFRVDAKTGSVYDENGEAFQPAVQYFEAGETSLEVDLDKNLKKKKNQMWLVFVFLEKVGDNRPEFYGIKYKY